MDQMIDVALDIIEAMYETDDVFWSYFDANGLDVSILEEHGIIIDGRIAIERNEIPKARIQPISKDWY